MEKVKTVMTAEEAIVRASDLANAYDNASTDEERIKVLDQHVEFANDAAEACPFEDIAELFKLQAIEKILQKTILEEKVRIKNDIHKVLN